MSIAVILSFLAFCLALAACSFAYASARRNLHKHRPIFHLTRHGKNPIISPLPIREWEMNGTFNPGAFQDDEGRVHLLYRAIGADGISRTGHASSPDGIHFDERSMYPVYEPLPGYGMPDSETHFGPKQYNPAYYTSGGGWGGSEDPRAVKIDDKVYMIYVAFEGWSSARLALTSIGLADAKRGRWNWKRPFLISPPGQFYKNWLLFPEKINGKYAIIHSIQPSIMIEYFDSLDELRTKPIMSRHPGNQKMRKGHWDSHVRGAGPPPIKTSIGWLLLYHATEEKDPGKYKIGAMILDLHDPTKIIYRSPRPILEPDMPYENDGKPGVVYATGAVILGDNLMVYYGAGDKHVCIAQTPLKQLLDWMVEHGKV